MKIKLQFTPEPGIKEKKKKRKVLETNRRKIF